MWAPRLPSVAPVSFFSRENSRPAVAGSAFSAAMIFSRSGWWMMSSGSALPLAAAHPGPAEDEPAAIDESHPQRKCLAEVEVADQRQHGDTDANRDKGVADPEARNRIEQHEINRPERSLLARRKMAEHVRAEVSEGKEQQERHQHPDIEGTRAHPGIAENADRKQTGDARNIDGNPDVTAISWPEPGHYIPRQHQHTPQDHDQAFYIINPPLPDPPAD